MAWEGTGSITFGPSSPLGRRAVAPCCFLQVRAPECTGLQRVWAPDYHALSGGSDAQADSGCRQGQVRVTCFVLTYTSEVPTLVRIERKRPPPVRRPGDSAAFEGRPCCGASGFAVGWKIGEVLLGTCCCVGGRPGWGSPGQREPPGSDAACLTMEQRSEGVGAAGPVQAAGGSHLGRRCGMFTFLCVWS